jgi:hypothetical protein
MSTDSDSEENVGEQVDIDLEPGEYVFETQRHRNGDETAVLLTSFAGGWQALAIDIADDGSILDLEEIGTSDDRGRAVGMCEYWLQQNPDGILGSSADGGGLGGQIRDMFGGN